MFTPKSSDRGLYSTFMVKPTARGLGVCFKNYFHICLRLKKHVVLMIKIFINVLFREHFLNLL
jgi:hypothetical protein